MAAIEVCKGIHSVGVLNPNMRVFDVVMKTEYGTSYNSYLVEGDHKKALIETVHHRYFNQYIQNIEQVCPLNEIDYVILNHNEPDHSGSLAMLMEKIPNATVVLSQAGSVYNKNITNRTDLKVQVAKSGDVIDLGGKTLSFVSAPFLHWPDSMFTYVKEDKLVFTCDFLGSHYCEPTMHDQEITYLEKYKFAFKGYYDAIFGPFKPYVIAGWKSWMPSMQISSAPATAPSSPRAACWVTPKRCIRPGARRRSTAKRSSRSFIAPLMAIPNRWLQPSAMVF
ncbi:FprA family A-type flavoprotein [Akkermansia muciniphila]|uniref:FprA family A-type flavoprotein n=1 Tax=Akkermansia muciniphila TaxID=239935 RepID=UPI00138717B4